MLEKKTILTTRRPKIKRKKMDEFLEKKFDSAKQKEIAEKIAEIYEDQDGIVPDMKNIKLHKKNNFLRFTFFLIFITAIMAVSAWAGFLYIPKNTKFSEEKIVLKIEGPTETQLGGTSTYKIIVENNLGVSLKNVTLNTNYPDGFIFLESDLKADNLGNTEWSLKDISASSTGEISITGQNFGSLNQQGSWRVFLNYKPENLSSQMQKITTLNTVVSLSPFVLNVLAPEKAAYGSDFEINYTLENKNDFIPEKMYVSLKLPEKFSITSSSPLLDQENRWVVSPTNTQYFPKNFKIIGRFNGELETTEKIEATLDLPVLAARQIYQIGQANTEIAISRTAFLMNLAINGSMNNFSAKPGDPLNITINFKNAGKTSLKNASIVLKLDAPSLKKVSVLDWMDINDMLDGTIIGKQISDTIRNGTITWNKNQLKDLTEIKPNQEISIDLRLPIKGAEKMDLSALKEHIINAVAEITFTQEDKTQKTVIANPISITMNSDFSFEKRVLSAVESNGKDRRDFTWILRNTLHPIKNIELIAEVYGDVTFVSTTLPAGNLNYASKEKIITWSIEEMPESLDILALPFSLIVNKTNPTQQVLLSKIKIKATDKITEQEINLLGEQTLLFEEKIEEEEDPFAR